MADTIIGIGELCVSKAPDTITTLGLGSCVGLVLYDRINRIGGMAHIMLPQAPPNVEQKLKAKYADTAFAELLGAMIRAGSNRYLIQAKLAGGAHMFSSAMDSDVMKVGLRNVEMCHRMLSQNSILILAEDVGGNVGRTINFNCETGALNIKTAYPRTEKVI